MPLSVCTITGTAYYANGALGDANIYITADQVTLNGAVIGSAAQTFYAEPVGGIITLTLPRGSTARLFGNVRGFHTEAVVVAIPDTATADLEDLIPVQYSGSLPQGLGTGSSPSFASIKVGNGTDAAPSYSFTDETDMGLYNNDGALIVEPASSSNIVHITSATGNTIQLHVIPAVAGGDGVFKIGTMVGATPYHYRIVAKNSTTNWQFLDNTEIPRMEITPTGGPLFPNTDSSPVRFRYLNGTNEGRIHYGTDNQFHIRNSLANNGVQIDVTKYNEGGSFAMVTDDAVLWHASNTGALRLNPAFASGYGGLKFYNSTGAGIQFWDHTGSVMAGDVLVTPTMFSLTAPLGLQIITSGARPAADVAHRGVIFMTLGGAGVADTVEICRKKADNAYEWITLI